MQEIKITQYNKLLVNYDTYEFTPSNYSQIVVDNPWFIDTSSAPDFMQSVKEINKYNDLINIPEDIYTYKYTKFNTYYTTGSTLSVTFSINTMQNKTHEEILNTINNKFYGTITYTDFYANISRDKEYYTSNVTDVIETNQILFPIINVAGYINNQYIPLIKSITITIDSSKFHMYIPKDTLSLSWNNTSTLSIAASDYKYIDYLQKILDHLETTPNYIQYIDTYNYMTINRFRNPICRISGTQFNKYNGIFHCFKNANLKHNTIIPANSRCLHVPSGNYTVDEFINKVNSNSSNVLFTLSSTKDYIYINCDMPFIINPICSIVNNDTDISETFNTKHILMKNPLSYRYFTASCQYKSQTYSQDGNFTPAEFLKWIYSVTGVKCRIHNNIIQCLDYDLIVGDNPYFVFKEYGIVENLCEMHTIDYQCILTNKINLLDVNYEPILSSYDYSSANITDNIITVMNTSQVKIFIP